MESPLKAGTAKVNITPPIGTWMQGYAARDRPSEGILDQLYVKALVLAADEENLPATGRIALITCDLIGLDEPTVRSIRKIIEESTGLKPRNVMIACSHTHSGPATRILKGMGLPDENYLQELKYKIAGAVRIANDNLQEATIGTGKGEADFSINRRLKTPEGAKMMPNPEGPIDREVGVMRINDAQGKPFAILFNFTCHATVLGANNYLISADYPGYAQKVVENFYGKNTIAMFTNGACGDVRPNLTDASGNFRPGDYEEARRLGTILGAEVIKASEQIQTYFNHISLKAQSKKIGLPLASPPPPEILQEEIRERRANLQKLKAEGAISPAAINNQQTMLQWAQETLSAVKRGDLIKEMEIEIQKIEIGDLILVGMPGEVFVEIGLKIKQKFASKLVFFIGYANGSIGYIPTAKAIPEGGYEVDLAYKYFGRPAPFSHKVEEIILQAL